MCLSFVHQLRMVVTELLLHQLLMVRARGLAWPSCTVPVRLWTRCSCCGEGVRGEGVRVLTRCADAVCTNLRASRATPAAYN